MTASDRYSSPLAERYASRAMLELWSAYALSGAGVLPRLPLLRIGLVAICAIYLLRAAALPWMLARMPDRGTTFLVVSSLIVLLYGLIHLIGIVTAWPRLDGTA